MALMPTMEDTRKPVALRIPGAPEAPPAVPPVVTSRTGVAPPVAPPTAPPVAPTTTTRSAPTSFSARSATTTTLPQLTIGNQTFTQGSQVPPGQNGVGLFGVKIPGSPQGAPPNPQPRTIWRGPQGVWYAWRPNGPNGDGWYRFGAGHSPSPTEAGVTTGTGTSPTPEPTSTTEPTPTPTPDAETTEGGTTTTTTPTFDPNWWMQQLTSLPTWMMQSGGIAAEENRTAAEFGYEIMRDTRQGSPTFGQVLYRPRGSAERSGRIVGTLEQIPGSQPPQARYVYRNYETGEVVDPSMLEIDVVQIQPGDPRYREGRIGQTTMQSRAQQAELGSTLAERGLRRSGIRASAAVSQVQALLDALRSLTEQAGTQFASTTTRWSDLINQLYPGLAESAQSLWEASQTPPGGEEPPADGEAGGEAPPAPPAAQPGPSFSAPNGITYGVGDRIAVGPDGVGMFSQKGTPGGNPPKNPKARELFRGKGGVWWVWRPNGPKGKGWYRYAPEAPGAPSATQAGVTTRT